MTTAAIPTIPHILAELTQAGHARIVPEKTSRIWRALGFSNAEVTQALIEIADGIRQRWSCSAEAEKRFANWVAARQAA